MVIKKKKTPARLKKVLEVDNALEGIFLSLRERLKLVSDLYDRFLLLTPYRYKPFVKSFDSFKQYEAWKKKQKNPWFW